MFLRNFSLFLGIAFISFSALAGDAHQQGYKPTRRYSAVAIDLRYAGQPTFHFAKDVAPAEGGSGVHPAANAWRRATNACGGVSARCYVLKSWGKHGCLAVYSGESRVRTIWFGHSLIQQHPLVGEGAIPGMIKDAQYGAENICNYHAHYDGKGPNYDSHIRYPRSCREYDVFCSDALRSEEYESLNDPYYRNRDW